MTELAISLDPHSKVPLYEQIYNYIRDEIRKRQILPGERLRLPVRSAATFR